MTENELADELVRIAKNRGDSISRQLADIVCQQQTDIKALRSHRAWIEETASIKELTDEEIDQIIKQHDWYRKTWVDMVRSIESAILKKASK
jgi:DNA-directed RNA polymerase subunit F